jgi:hypothetical protein
MCFVTASSGSRLRRAIALAGPQAIVHRWSYRHPDPDPVRAAAGHTGAAVYRLLIACRACGSPYVGEHDGPVLAAWAEHVRQVHPQLLAQVPCAGEGDVDWSGREPGHEPGHGTALAAPSVGLHERRR